MTRKSYARSLANYLNSLLAADRNAMHQLLEYRVPCSRRIIDHPTAIPSESPTGGLEFGALGLINGIAGLHGELIEACYDERGRLIHFLLRVNHAETAGTETDAGAPLADVAADSAV